MTDKAVSVELAIGQWCTRNGFLSNPFDSEAVSAERDKRLPDCFVEFPYFTELLGAPGSPGPRFIFARRGGGKSTLRLQIQRSLEETLQDGTRRALTTTYDQFDVLCERVGWEIENITLRMHVEQIIGRIVTGLFELGVQEKPVIDLRSLGEHHRRLLRWYLDSFSRCLHPWQLSRFLGKLEGIFHFVSVENILKGTQKVTGELAKAVPGASAIVETLNEIAQWQPQGVDKAAVPNRDLLEGLVEIVQELELVEILVLVDNVDEAQYAGEQYDFEPAFQLIRSLGAAVSIMQIPSFVIKFFLPAEIMSLAHDAFRFDLFKERLIEWDDEALARILEQRLRIFSGGVYTSLAPLCEEDLGHEIDRLLLRRAQTPRELLQIGYELLAQHFRLPSEEPFLTRNDWQRALREIQRKRRHRAFTQRNDAAPREPIDRSKLLDVLMTRFDESELRNLCFVLDVDYESLPGQGKAAKARELVKYAQRHDRLFGLVEVCRELRPRAPW